MAEATPARASGGELRGDELRGDELRGDELRGDELARALGVPRVLNFDEVECTLDIAHEEAAADAPSGTVIVARRQRAGRGTAGRAWDSPVGGIWLTVVERPDSPPTLQLLSLRVGLHVARSLDVLAGTQVSVKWPNDLYLNGGKLGGILLEARWRGSQPDWVAIGVGINRSTSSGEREPVGDGPPRAALACSVPLSEVLAVVVPAVRLAARAEGPLSQRELEAWATRDYLAGRMISAPVRGIASGLEPDGALRVCADDQSVVLLRSGSVRLA